MSQKGLRFYDRPIHEQAGPQEALRNHDDKDRMAQDPLLRCIVDTVLMTEYLFKEKAKLI